MSRRSSPPLEEHPDAPCRPVRPVTPPVREERPREGFALREQPAVQLNVMMFGGLRAILIDPTVDPPPYHCYNCWQHGHDMPQCPRSRVREICNNCGRHGVDLHDCPRCSAAHQRFVRANFANEQEMAEKTERQNREPLRLEEERRSAIHREELRAEQEWQARMQRKTDMRHRVQYQAVSVNQLHVYPAPTQQLQARPSDALAEAASLVEGLRSLPQTARDVIVRAPEDSLRRR